MALSATVLSATNRHPRLPDWVRPRPAENYEVLIMQGSAPQTLIVTLPPAMLSRPTGSLQERLHLPEHGIKQVKRIDDDLPSIIAWLVQRPTRNVQLADYMFAHAVRHLARTTLKWLGFPGVEYSIRCHQTDKMLCAALEPLGILDYGPYYRWFGDPKKF